MDEATFIRRTTELAVAVVKIADGLPKTRSSDVIARQVIRSATSVAANYRASCRARSVAEIIAKLGIVEEEADETLYWLELLVSVGAISEERARPLIQETDEIVRMTVASKRTLKNRRSG